MTKKIVILASAAIAICGLSACQQDSVLDKAPGTYQSKTSSTDANGTTRVQKSTTDVSVDSNGNKKAVVTSKTSNDPKGLFNKTTTQSEQVIEERQ